jgi:hypothetical protein
MGKLVLAMLPFPASARGMLVLTLAGVLGLIDIYTEGTGNQGAGDYLGYLGLLLMGKEGWSRSGDAPVPKKPDFGVH